ncbi:aspartate/glutamate racemase family protein [Thioclava sp. 15-R06ZXC-3]|uniref:Aspartate/glutamate racemase family protein n=1 Tax=Thioclava arctica TaxID=3238301 RepID=A0ABV3TQC0_9RHOB
MMRRVGILGGMGPEATILVMQKVLGAVRAQDDSDHVPLIVDQNPQVPSRIRHLIEGTGENPGPVLADMARRLVAGGAQALAIPCNTAHHYLPAIRATVAVPVLDMVQLSIARAASLAGPGGTVGVLGSPALLQVKLFDAAAAQHGLELRYSESEEDLLAAIRQIKAQGPQPGAREKLAAASSVLFECGATVQMIACTEFSLIPEAVCPRATVFDTLDELVAAILAFATSRAERRSDFETR